MKLHLLRACCVGLLVISQVGCAVHSAVTLAPTRAAQESHSGGQLREGEPIVITLKDKRRLSGIFVEITATELVTRRARYPLGEIRSISYQQLDKPASVLATLGGITAGILAVGVIVSAAFVYAIKSSD